MIDEDNNYHLDIQETIREFTARRITVNDIFIFNCNSSITKVSGDSQWIMPMGASSDETSPIQVSSQELIKNESYESKNPKTIVIKPLQ